ARVGGNLIFDQSRIVAGGFSLLGADIVGQLSGNGAELADCDGNGNALLGDQLKIGAGLFLNRFRASGAVRFLGADVTGNFQAVEARIDAPGRAALNADSIAVSGPVRLDRIVVSGGSLRLVGSDLGSTLHLEGADLCGRDEEGHAFSGDRLKVAGGVYMSKGFRASAAVSVQGADIGKSLDLTEAELVGDPAVLKAAGMRVGQEFLWLPRNRVGGSVDLDHAAVGRLIDHWTSERPEGNWPPYGRLHLTGFTYGGFDNQHQPDVQDRLEKWIWKTHTDLLNRKAFALQPYEQLVRVYRQAGQEGDAKAVGIAKQRDLRRFGELNRPERVKNWLLDRTVGYGYRPLGAVAWLAVLYAVVALLSWWAQHRTGMVQPTRAGADMAEVTALSCERDYPCFYPLGYAIDVVIPLVHVGQFDSWRITGQGHLGWALVAFSWLATILGWVITSLAVAGITGIIRKD
ncbi:hypothetical protein, partial [Micromonospora echinofusca]